ncbi:MAG: carbonic anhydrase [Desulfobacterales bacterium]|nr:carbonic anhydrase [Desulfobacterales bacterium]
MNQMVKNILTAVCVIFVILLFILTTGTGNHDVAEKPSPDEAINMLKAGNQRFVEGKSEYPHTNAARLEQAGKENQGDHAYATVITCSDSRVPVELIFDAGIMDIFVIRVAGNVCDVDEIGSIEYGLAHVNTPVLVILGHTQCGAVTAVTHAVHGTGHALERNIPPLVDNIEPAVKRAMAAHPDIHGDEIIPYAIEENVWKGIEDLFMNSPASRNIVNDGKAKVVGAIYDVSTGKVSWLPEEKSIEILKKVEANPLRAMEAMAGGGHGGESGHGTKVEHAAPVESKHEKAAAHH